MAVERFPIEEGHVLLFARSIGDPDPAPQVPPTFVQASAQFDPDYPLRPKAGQPWFGSGREASGLMRASREPAAGSAPAGDAGEAGDKKPRRSGGGGLHAEQHYEYHAPVQVGDVLTATNQPGRTWEKEGRRGGKLHFSEGVTEYRNQDGVLVVTARSVAVRTERPAKS